jgi:hypothetical protein
MQDGLENSVSRQIKSGKTILCKKSVAFLVLGAIYLSWQILTLPYHPLPWFDDTYFASVSLSLMEHGNFIPQVAYHALDGREALIYGPVYFFLTGTFIKIAGLGILQFRIVNLLFGILCIWISYKIIDFRKSGYTSVLFIAVFALDPFFTLSMHEGRMDVTALFFGLLSLYFALRAGKTDIYYSATAAALALLTTPRSAILIAGVGMVLLMNVYKDGKLKPLILWPAIILGIYSIWIFYAFGGPAEFLNCYQTLHSNEKYLGGLFYVPRSEYVLIFSALFCLVLHLINKNKDFPDSLSSVAIAVILLFYAVVRDWGSYSSMIIPFYYMLIFNKEELRWSFSNPKIYVLIILLVHNLGYFTLKSADILSSLNQRDPETADRFIADHISPGSKVVGDPLYFYSVKKSGSNYQYFDKYGSPEAREQKHRELYNYDYLIVTEQSLKGNRETVALYMGNSRFQKVAELRIPRSELNKKISSWGLISNIESSGYNATIYIRIKGPETFPMAVLQPAR